MKRLPILAGVLLLVFGCSPKTATSPTANGETKDPAAPVSATEPKDASTEKSPAIDLSTLPANLRHEGYEYYGLGNAKPMDLELTQSPGSGEVLTGSQTTTLVSVENGVATFRRERTGGLERLGVDEYTVEPTGVYVKSSTVAKTKGHDLEIPAELPAGKTWSDSTDIEMNGQTLKMKSTFKVVGEQSVKTKTQTYKALLINSTGNGALGDKKVRMDSQSWYAKGVGMVKTIIKTTDGKGIVTTITLQAV